MEKLAYAMSALALAYLLFLVITTKTLVSDMRLLPKWPLWSVQALPRLFKSRRNKGEKAGK